MEPQEKLTNQQFIVDRLLDIQRKAKANNFTDIRDSIKEVKAADVKNIYLIALEKQITKLVDASQLPESREGILKSLPAMIDRAISDIQRRTTTPNAGEVQKGQKEAALEKLKSQYFQRTDDYVEKKEYQRALEEIRRIYIIEPGSIVAKEYERKIEQLIALQSHKETDVEPRAEAKEIKKITPDVELPKKETVQQSEEILKKFKLPIIATAALVILILGVWLIFFRGSKDAQSNQGLTIQPSATQGSDTSKLAITTTSASQTGKKPGTTTKLDQSAKTQKTQETQSAAAEQKPSQTTAMQQVKTPAAVQTSPQQQITQPASATTTLPQPDQQQPKIAENTPASTPFVVIESPPVVIKLELAKYPDIAVKMGIQGKVFVEVTVDAQGKPIQAKVVKSPSDIFNESSVEAAMKSTYKPAMMSTGPVTSKIVVPFDFRLRR